MTKLYNILFSTFWVLYLTSFVGTVFSDDKEVTQCYANLMICSIVVACTASPLIGIFVDRVSPRVTLPVSFLIRGFGIVLFTFIKDPTHGYAYFVGTILVLGTSCESICSDTILMRNAERGIRGLIFGTAGAFGYFG